LRTDDTTSRLDPVKHGHTYVHQHDIGPQPPRSPDGVFPIDGFADDRRLGLVLEDLPESDADQSLVVGDQNRTVEVFAGGFVQVERRRLFAVVGEEQAPHAGRVARLTDLGQAEAAFAEAQRIAVGHGLALAETAGLYRLYPHVAGLDGSMVEAVLEDLPLKQKLFAEIERHARPDTILASNTSVIPITAIMQGLDRRERALGTHWWNPPFLVPLVEVIGTKWTSQQAIDWTMRLHADAGKTPVHVKKDVPGFIGNRLQHALWRECIALVQNGICDAETVDTVIKASFGRRLAVLGPLENADLVGTDLTLAIHKTVLPDIDRTPGPLPYLEKLVAQGKLGMKSGEGFRAWTPEQQQALWQGKTVTLKEMTAAQRGLFAAALKAYFDNHSRDWNAAARQAQWSAAALTLTSQSATRVRQRQEQTVSYRVERGPAIDGSTTLRLTEAEPERWSLDAWPLVVDELRVVVGGRLLRDRYSVEAAMRGALIQALWVRWESVILPT